MAKDDTPGEKTEPATPKRKEEAREKGQVAKSQDLSAAISLLVGFSAIKILGPWLGGHILDAFKYPFQALHVSIDSQQGEIAKTLNGSSVVFLILLPLIIIFLIIAIAVPALQVGWKLSPKAFELDFNKMNPISGMKKIVGMRGLMKMLTGIAKISIVSVVLFFFISGEMPRIMEYIGVFDYQNNNAGPPIVYLMDRLCWLGIYAGATLTVVAIIDYAYQKWQLEQDLKMSKQEVKDEMKNMEGDPLIKRKRLERARDMAQRRMENAVPEADVVVTNPTHYSCALRYSDMDAAPRLLAKGVDRLALRIREIATENKVPIVEKPELARALYRWVEVDELIPDKYWKSVAEVLAYVYQMDESRKKRAMSEDQAQEVPG